MQESSKLKLAVAFLHLWDGTFLCPFCRAPNKKMSVWCDNCGKDLSNLPIYDRLKRSEQIKYDYILSELRGDSGDSGGS